MNTSASDTGQYWYEGVDSAPKLGRIVGMAGSAAKFVAHTLRLDRGDHVCLLTDTEVSPLVYYTLAAAIRNAGGTPSVVIIEPLALPGAEPPSSAAAAMSACDFLVGCVSRSVTHSAAAHRAYLENGVRYVVMSNATEDLLLRGAATADMDVVKQTTLRTAEALNQGTAIHVTSPHGTDVEFDISGRSFVPYFGEFADGSRVTIFPGGEVNTAPLEHSGNGKIVFDSFMMEIGLLKEPIVWDLEDGRIVRISGGSQARQLEKLLDDRGDEFSRYIGELAVGTNHAARSIGSSLEDKEVYGHIHIACGTGVSAADGSWHAAHQSTLHLDGVMTQATLRVDGVEVVKDGEIVPAPRPRLGINR